MPRRHELSADRRRPLLLFALGLVLVLVCAALVIRAVGGGDGGPASGRAIGASAPGTETDQAPSPPPLPLAGRTVVLDPGHNRDNAQHLAEIGRPVDAGGFEKACNTTGTATADGLPEATINWKLALALQDRLEALGATVPLTRDADAGWGPCIDERGRAGNGVGADLLLSLHADGAAAGAHGFHVIQPGLLPGWTDDIQADSARAALAVRDELVAAGLSPATYLGRDGIDERTDLGTLNHSDVPAVMLEAGNLGNPADAALLTAPAGRGIVADALAEAVVAFVTE
ncbi:N-acetylmuramoyl-L-alanine amidase [Blastococcus sp. VKM Ac-2987]|uniref:N-acetylmuramoyl-L-alanine amidase n=1 Tax=Blastococcus sp. VKM Ac-2987 TaxID=3004141 RepID=UPI0022AB5B79|nr:N-acetylmuramoyl-L-alanine amidase [Blastococcus sp. VKM Ac-2987]MCZ2858475.1 N-acetylmuramoyl-L-alanine amidase [Blastococcus sp. VKM Ac-2987]